MAVIALVGKNKRKKVFQKVNVEILQLREGLNYKSREYEIVTSPNRPPYSLVV